MPETRVFGELCKWVHGKSYGFISPDDGGNDIFAHITGFGFGRVDIPREGERFSFVVEFDKTGRPRAVDIRRVGADAAAKQVFAGCGHER